MDALHDPDDAALAGHAVPQAHIVVALADGHDDAMDDDGEDDVLRGALRPGRGHVVDGLGPHPCLRVVVPPQRPRALVHAGPLPVLVEVADVVDAPLAEAVAPAAEAVPEDAVPGGGRCPLLVGVHSRGARRAGPEGRRSGRVERRGQEK